MNKILQALAEDNLCINPSTYKGTPQYRKVIKAMCEAGEALEDKLNGEEKELFEQFRDAQSEEAQLYAVERFIRGYRVGVMMMCEVFAGTSDLILSKEGE